MPVELRPPRVGDVDLHMAIAPSEKIHVLYGGDPDYVPEPSRARSEAWLAWLQGHEYARLILVGNRLAGEVRLHSHDPEMQSARLAIGLYSEADLGRGFGRSAVRQALRHGFGPMGLSLVDLRVLDFNSRAIRCYEVCGFVEVDRIPRVLNLNGIWHDDLVMEISRDVYFSTGDHS